jgi:hypothetical protein
MDKCREAFENSLGHTDGFHDGYVTYNPITGMYESNDDDYECVADWLNGAWMFWQSRQAEIDEKDKKLKSVEQILIELKESMTNFKEMDLYDKGVRVVTDCIIRDLEKALRGEHE